MNYYAHHLGDYARDTAHLTMLEHGAYRTLLDRYYSTETGIPADQVYRISRARSREERQAVDAVLADFFTLEDGVWINKRAQEEINKAAAKKPDADKKRDNDKERQRRARERRKGLFESLSAMGIHMRWNATTEELQAAIDAEELQAAIDAEELQAAIDAEESAERHAHVTRDSTTRHAPVTVDNTCTKTPINQYLKPNPLASGLPTSGPPTPAGAVCARLRRAGISAVNPSHPRLLTLIEAGCTEDEFADVAAEAGGKGFAWILATVEGRRRDAAAAGPVVGTGGVKPRQSGRQAAISNYAAEAAMARGEPPNEHAAGVSPAIDGESVRVA